MNNLKLFSKGKIGSMTLKNRLVVPPMGITSEPDGSFSDRSISYYEDRAKGGFGLIITGYSSESPMFEATTCNVLNNVKEVAAVHDLVQRVHSYGTKICLQLGPGLGRISGVCSADKSKLPYSASAIDYFWDSTIKCQPLTINEIKGMVDNVGFSAGLAKQGGADAVELRVYGGYLADQFMTSLWNTRKDEYGGDLQGRMRFTMELFESIQANCGKDYPLIVKYNPYHAIPGGRELAEGIEIAKMLEKAGAAALHLDKGCYEAWYNAISTVYQPDAHQVHLAEEIKKVVNIPVISQGKLGNPVIAEKVLAEGRTDFVALGHQSIADAHWPNKVKEGKIREIIPCIGCNECITHLFSGKHINCSVNPQSYHEDEYQLSHTPESKKILVIGGGPGGITAATTAAERGHDVTLWEKSDQLGGLLNAAGAPVFKKQVKEYVDYAVRKLDCSDVDIRLLKEANAENVLYEGFDHVILASGARSIVPPIKGIDSDYVYTSTDVLTGKVNIECNEIIVLGGGLVGCETAVFLAQKGKKVAIVEMLDDILKIVSHSLNNDQALRALVKESNIQIHTGTKATVITSKGVTAIKDGKEIIIPCGSIVLACGYLSNNELADQLESKVDITIIGDCESPRKILNAVHEGFHAGRVL